MPTSPHATGKPRLLVCELWGLGDLALAIPFLRVASAHRDVTLLAKPHAAPLLARFAPQVELIPLVAPWTAFRGKYRLASWPWRELAAVIRQLRQRQFATAVSARRDPRDHVLLRLAGAPQRLGYPRVGSRLLLTRALPAPPRPHRAAHWQGLAAELGWSLPEPVDRRSVGRTVVIHPGAAQPTRRWPASNYTEIARRLRAAGWQVVTLDDTATDLAALLDQLAHADRFIGNDSGPGHLAALLGVPTFTIFGPSLPELFAAQHPRAAWIDGAPCPHKPCYDTCRFAAPHCIRDLSVETVWSRVNAWLATT